MVVRKTVGRQAATEGEHSETLVFTTAEDGLVLAGLLLRPVSALPRSIGVVVVHGLTGSFYTGVIVALSRRLADAGHLVVAGNNRGHDLGAVDPTSSGDPKLAGAAWERFDESPRDIAAWVDFVAGLGAARVALVGHSLGAYKVVHYQAQRQDSRVAGVAAASPPTRRGRQQRDVATLAERMVAEGNGLGLLPWGTYPIAGALSAQTYLDQLQPHVDVFGFRTPEPAVGQIRCPLFAFYGGEETWVGTPTDLETVCRNAVQAPRVETRLFPGADHVYTGREDEVAIALAEWLDSLRQQDPTASPTAG